MATTTPNYGWAVPTSTDLVKDGATAIETLGDSADATVKALNPSTTLGDIEYQSATANTNTRLAIGSTGNVLTVAGGVPTWAAPAGGGITYTLLSTTTLATGSPTSVTVSSLTRDEIIVVITQAKTNAAADVYKLTPTCGTVTGSINIRVGHAGTNDIYTAGTTINSGNIDLGGSTANSGTGEIFAFYRFTGCKSTSPKAFNAGGGSTSTSTNTNSWIANGIMEATAALTAVTYTTNGGGAFTGGTMKIYGA